MKTLIRLLVATTMLVSGTVFGQTVFPQPGQNIYIDASHILVGFMPPQVLGTNSVTPGYALFSDGTTLYWGQSATPGGSVTNLAVNNLTNTFLYSSNAFITNLTVTGGITNSSLSSSSIVETDSNKRLQSIANAFGVLTNDGAGNVGFTADGNSLTNLHYAYTTNAVPNTGVLTFGGKSYVTNIQANITLPAFAAVDPTLYETLVLRVTNSTASDLTVTMPSGVLGTPGAGLPAVFYCTNKVTTYIYVSHYCRDATNAWKQDFAQ